VHEVARRGLVEPEFGQSAEVRLVVHGQRDVLREQSAEVRVVPVEVGGAHHGPGVACHQAGHGDGESSGPQAFLGRLGDDLPYQPGQFPQHRFGRPAAIGAVPHRPGPDLTAQIDSAHGEMVDAHLRTDTRRTAPAECERGAGSPHPPGPLGTQLIEEP
jgi:hypothetical protein